MKITKTPIEKIITISPKGSFDFKMHNEFQAAYEEAIVSPDAQLIRINMKEVEFLDSSALGMLLRLKQKANIANKAVKITNSHGEVARIFDMAQFAKLFDISCNDD